MDKSLLLILLCLCLAALLAAYMNPPLVKLAFSKRILDHPNARKLQNRPIPVIGGISVFAAATAMLLISNLFIDTSELYVPLLCLFVIFFVGLFDDMIGISFVTKFAFQIVVIFFLWYLGFRLDDLDGIFGINNIHMAPSLILSILAGVGLINAMNLIDGVDGLSSGLGILSGSVIGVNFILHGDIIYSILAFSFVGALIPFFTYNVFSRKYKMFIGDAGSLVLGTLAYLFTCRIIDQPIIYNTDLYSISLMLTIYAVPVFDTIRVMVARMLRGHSPFLPDKTHLHHLFIAMGYPHVVVASIILIITTGLLAIWFVLAFFIKDVTIMTIVMGVVSAMLVWGIYLYYDHQRNKISRTYARSVLHARMWRRRIHYIYYRLQCIIDHKEYPYVELGGTANTKKGNKK